MIKGPRMNVRSEEGAETRQAGWHRRNDFSDLSQQKELGQVFIFCPGKEPSLRSTENDED